MHASAGFAALASIVVIGRRTTDSGDVTASNGVVLSVCA